LLRGTCSHVLAGERVTESNFDGPGESRIRLYPVTPALRNRLSELVDERQLKHRELSRNAGGDISYETARQILAGGRSQVRLSTLVALADVLRVPVDELIDLSLGSSHDRPWRPPAEFDPLPETMRPGIERGLLIIFRATGILPPS
jgi:DNA-binding Xre family transcriptional regulator